MKWKKSWLSVFLILGVFFIFYLYGSGFLTDFIFMLTALSGQCESSFTVEGETKNVHVYHCPEDQLFQTQENVSAVASINGKIIKYQNKTIPSDLLMHELGHTLGFKHTKNSTIMSTLRLNRMSGKRKLTKQNLKIAREFEGFKIINWSEKKDRKYIKKQIEKDHLSRYLIAEIPTMTSNYNNRSTKVLMNEYKKKKCLGIYSEPNVSWINNTERVPFYIKCGKPNF